MTEDDLIGEKASEFQMETELGFSELFLNNIAIECRHDMQPEYIII